MKHRIFHIIFSCLVILSCAGTKSQKHTEDYTVAELALKQFPKMPKFRLIATPVEGWMEMYMNGYEIDSLNFSNTKFSYSQTPVKKWDLKNSNWSREIKDRTEIIPDFDKVPQLPLSIDVKADTYISLSNPIYSTDGRYAWININIFSNMDTGNSDGYILIFKKINGKWEYYSRFTAYLT